ncbi:MAG: GNAT family N-acetyltransferase [Chloroflexota bacterium]|nr:GNAT family N-acetyltransferase [Chloroflexota bacterium]
MNVSIRPFAVDDYPAILAIRQVVLPEHPATIEELQHWDAHRDPKCKFARWVAEMDGQVVAYGSYDQNNGMYHPRRFGVYVAVRPEQQGQGIGSALYEHVMTALDPFEPLSVRTRARADRLRTLRFLAERGFQESMRDWESRLQVAACDITRFSDIHTRVRAQGIVIKTLAELADDPQRDRKLYELDIEVAEDVPSPEPFTAWSYEFFAQHVLRSPRLLPDAYFVALLNGAYVGVSVLWSNPDSRNLSTGLTGVKRSYRRKGIALALKLRAIQLAQAYGAPVVNTWNESNNRPMLSINGQLGFVKQPASVHLVKLMQQEVVQ